MQGPGLANIATGLLGGMAGSAMIGQSVINVKSGGRSRLSTLVAGVTLLLMVVFLSDWVGRIPMAALVAVMIMVSIGTFRWESIRNLKRYPLSTNLVMLVTVGVVLATHNLAFGVVAGVLLASLFFANKIGHYLDIDSERSADGTRRHYQVSGQVFFASSGRFVAAFDLKETLEHVLIDLRHAHLWDVTAVAALDKGSPGLSPARRAGRRAGPERRQRDPGRSLRRLRQAGRRGHSLRSLKRPFSGRDWRR